MNIVERYNRAKKLGVCRVHPGVFAESGACAECRAKQSLLHKKLREKRIKDGLCSRCGGSRVDKKPRLCEQCRAHFAASYVAKKAVKP